MKLARLWMMKFMTCGKLHTKGSRMKTQTRENLCEPPDVYRFYHFPYKDHFKIIRDEWVEEYELQDPP